MLFANNCNTTLSGSLTNVATTMSVTSATGFPSPTGSQYFYCTLADAATQTTIEIVKVTAVSGTTFTIVRGQDGTSGTAFASGAVVSLRLVSASLNDFPKLDENNTFTYAPTFNTALAVGSGGTGLTSLTAGYIPYGNGTSAFSSSANLFFNGNLGIGTNNPTDTNGFGQIVDLNGTSGAAFYARTAGSATNVTTFGNYGADGYISNNGAGNIRFSAAGSLRMLIYASGGVSIGNTTDPGATNLSVTGSLKLGTALSVANGGTGQTSFTTGYLLYGNGTSGLSTSSNLFFNGSSLGIGTTSPVSGGFGSGVTVNVPTGQGARLDMQVNGASKLAFTADANWITFDANSPYRYYYNGTQVMTLFASGGLSLGNTTDPGAGSLSVNGVTTLTAGARTGKGTITVTTATPTTLFSASAEGRYDVAAFVSGVGDANYAAFATVISTGADSRIVASNGVIVSLTISGGNVQVTQISGSNLNVTYSYIKMSSA